jgi:hypothetical protein
MKKRRSLNISGLFSFEKNEVLYNFTFKLADIVNLQDRIYGDQQALAQNNEQIINICNFEIQELQIDLEKQKKK